tara:strand:- start:1655 stop:2056 length:402 start_codon:yes stop_codon:yes gene_type:complete
MSRPLKKGSVVADRKMGFKATHRHARISATKVRPLANMVRGKFADEALSILRFQPQRGARLLEKVIRSALGNAQDVEQAKDRSIDVGKLVVTDARVDSGPMFKRIRPRARGMAFVIKKRMAHIHVELEELDSI